MATYWRMGLTADGHIWIKLPYYDPSLNKELKARLPGPVHWDRDLKRWDFPPKWDTCTNARKVADSEGHEILLSPELRTWALEEKARQEQIPDVNSMELTDLPIIRQHYPAIWSAITSRPFQTVGAAFAARNRSCLIADQPGLGKTVQSIAAVIEADIRGPILVVAPKAAAQLVWPQELARWVPSDRVEVLGAHIPADLRNTTVEAWAEEARIYDDPVTDEPGRLWVITSPHYVRIRAEVDKYGKYKYGPDKKKIIKPVGEAVMELFNVKWSSVIVDESHQTLAGASGDKKKQSAQRLGLGALEVREDGLRIALSGTPFRGKEEYLWGQLNWLRPDLYRSRWRWINDHFDVGSNGFGMVIGSMVDREGMYKEAATVMIRRTKAEVAKDLPPKQYAGWPLDPAEPKANIAVWLDMNPKQAKAYAQIEKSAKAELEGGNLYITGLLAQLTRLKQFAASYGTMVDGTYGDMHFKPTLPSNKFDWLVEFLDERGIDKNLDPANTPKIVVASQFSQLIDAFAIGLNELGIKGWKFTGGTSPKGRELIVNDWQDNPTSNKRVLLLTTTAGGTGLTLDAGDDLVVLDETWDSSQQEQLEDRLHRISKIHQVTIWKVFSRGTIEEKIAKTNIGKELSIKAILDGERGVDFAKMFLGVE
jgi:SNF2 family DNA or RNA helicase